jgi:protein SCO1
MRARGRGCVESTSTLLLGIVVWMCPVWPALAGGEWGANHFPNVQLITHDGVSVRLYDDLLKGKTVAINLIYTHCKDECPLETARLAQVQRTLGARMGKDVFFYSITIDPDRDTPPVLKAYAERFHAGPGWLFLTGKKADVELVRAKLGLGSDPDPANRDGHVAHLLIGNEPTGQWIRNSALNNPKYLAVMIGNFVGGWTGQPSTSYANAPRLAVPEEGQHLFQMRCAACHTIGHGDGLGPDLHGVTARRDAAWLARWLSAPDEMLAAGDPIATDLLARYKNLPMPNLRLSDDDVAAVIAYMTSRSNALDEASRR